MNLCMSCEARSNTFLCPDDTGRLRGLLFRVPATLRTADATLHRMSVGARGEGGAGGKAGSAAPGDLTMFDHLETYRATLAGWAATLADTLHERAPRDTAPAAEWLLHHLKDVTRHEWAGEALYELRAAERDILRASDRPGTRVTLGTCGRLIHDNGRIQTCPGTVKAYEGAEYARCDYCSEPYDAQQRRTDRIAQAFHVIAPVPQVVRALVSAGYPVKYETAKKWVQRGKLHPRCDLATRSEGVSPADVLKLAGTVVTGT